MDELKMAKAQAMVIENLLEFATEKLWELCETKNGLPDEMTDKIVSAICTINTVRELAYEITKKHIADSEKMGE